MKTYTAEELRNILELHKKWINNDGGKRANLQYTNLEDVNLHNADLRGADLRGADLQGLNLEDANLQYANLEDANLCGANLCGANLRGANLRGANLWDANLWGVNLQYATGNLTHVKSLQCEKYFVTYTAKVMQIGCKRYTIEDWRNFNDEKIKGMDDGALEWWTKWKPIIMQLIEMSPCEPTKDEE